MITPKKLSSSRREMNGKVKGLGLISHLREHARKVDWNKIWKKKKKKREVGTDFAGGEGEDCRSPTDRIGIWNGPMNEENVNDAEILLFFSKYLFFLFGELGLRHTLWIGMIPFSRANRKTNNNTIYIYIIYFLDQFLIDDHFKNLV